MFIREKRNNDGFTLVELMVALMIAAIVFSAVATLANATACADKATEQMGREQAQLRQVSVVMTDLIKRANQVIAADSSGFQLWHDVNADGIVDAGETTLVSRDGITTALTVDTFGPFSECLNAAFQYDAAAPATRFIMIQFEMDENGVTQTHTVSAKLRVSDDH